MKKLTLLTLAILGATLAQAQTDPKKPVIAVNGTPITYGTYYKRMEGLQGFGRRVGDKFVPSAPGFLTLQQLINEQLMVELAVDKGVPPTEQELEDEYASLLKEAPDQVASMMKFGTTPEDIRQQIRVQLSEFKLQTMGINIADQQVDTFYKENPSIYTTPKTIDLYAISVESAEQQDAVDKRLNSNEPFADVAKELSLDLSKALGGYLGRIIEANLPDRIRKQIEVLKESEVTGWVDADKRKYKYFIGKVYPQSLAKLTPELRKAIHHRLMIDRGRIKNDLNVWMKQKRATLKLDFKGTPFDEDIKEAFVGGN